MLVIVALLASFIAGCGSSSSDQVAQQEKVQQVKDQIGQIKRYIAQHQSTSVGNRHGQPSSANVTRHRHQHIERHVVPCRNGEYGDFGYRYPGRILGIPDGYFYSGDMTGRKMWWVNDCRHFTVVGGGADPDHLQMGLLGILRERDRTPHRESLKYIKVPGASAVLITKAPLGPSVETWAQRRGNIEFTSKNGITGTLHLKDDSVTLDQ